MKNLKLFRKNAKLSQDYVAWKLGVSRSTIVLWERGKTEPTASNIIKLAELFGVSVNELLGV